MTLEVTDLPQDVPSTDTTTDPVQAEQVAEVVTETTQTDESQEQAPQSQTDDAAFLAGFDAADGKEPPPPEPEKSEPEPPKFAGYTEAEIKEMAETVKNLSSREAKVFGTLGSLKQQLDALRAQPASQPVAAKLTKETFKRLAGEFPEMAEALAEDLADLQVQGAGADPTEIARIAGQLVDTRTQEIERTYERKLLAVKHPDWKETIATPEFAEWMNTLPAEDQDALKSSWDSDIVGEKLSQFKDWKSKTVQVKETKTQRLANAITPRGSANVRPVTSDEDEFIKGFNSVGKLR